MRKQSVWFNPLYPRGSVIPVTNNSADLGSSSKAFRNAYLSADISLTHATNPNILATAGQLRLGTTANQNLIWRTNGSDRWSIDTSGNLTQNASAGGDFVFGLTQGIIRQNTSDGSDNKYLEINGGGGTGTNRGARLLVFGNEAVGTGVVVLATGDVTGAYASIDAGNSTGYVRFRTGSSVLERWRINASGELSQDGTNGGAIKLAHTTLGGIEYTAASGDTFFGTVNTRDIRFYTGNVNRWRVLGGGDFAQDATNGGNFIMSKDNTTIMQGISAIPADISALVSPRLLLFRASAGTSISHARGSADAFGATFDFFKSRATNGSADTVVTSGDTLGYINFYGADGASYVQAASILVRVDGTPGTNDMPGRMEFHTTADGASSPVRRWYIANGGDFTQDSSNGGNIVFTRAGSNNVYSTGAAAMGIGTNANQKLLLRANSSDRWSIETNGDLRQDATNGGDLVFGKSDCFIHGTSADGSDNQQLYLNPTGQAFGSTNRGAGIRISGNESSNAGSVQIHTGDTTYCTFDNKLGGSQSKYRVTDNADVLKFAVSANNFFELDKTVTAGGTTGARTINKALGTVNFAAGATSIVVTNNTVSSTSIVFCTVRTNDATLKSVQAVSGTGSFTIYANAAATAETSVGFLVLN